MKNRNIALGAAAAVVTLLVIGLSILYNNPPLVIGGRTYYVSENNKIVLEISNKGFTKIHLSEVSINGGIKPEQVELGISRTSHLVLGAGLDEDPYISFVEIGDEPINPVLPPEKRAIETMKRTIPLHYGIRIYAKQDIEEVHFKYYYLGLPFSLKYKISRDG